MQVIKQEDITRTDEMPTSKGGNAVGVPSRKWCVTIVKNNTEFSCFDRLEKKGSEASVPIQEIVNFDCKEPRNVVFEKLDPRQKMFKTSESK